MPGEGLEPSRPCGHMILSHARIPIPPPGLRRNTFRFNLLLISLPLQDYASLVLTTLEQ